MAPHQVFAGQPCRKRRLPGRAVGAAAPSQRGQSVRPHRLGSRSRLGDAAAKNQEPVVRLLERRFFLKGISDAGHLLSFSAASMSRSTACSMVNREVSMVMS